MSEITIHPDIADLEEREPARFSIYQILLQGMMDANASTPPDYSKPPFSIDTGKKWVDVDGTVVPLLEPDQEAISAKMAEISQIQMQNAAYLFARVIDTAATSGGVGIDINKLVQKSGDSMLGAFGALKGFEAGSSGRKVFDVTINAADENVAHVYGLLIVDEDLTIDGKLNLSDEGIYFSKHQCIYYDNSVLKFDSQDFQFTGDILVDGSISIGDVSIDNSGIFWGNNEFYHSGNCNNKDVDWVMGNGHVYGDLIIDGQSQLSGRLKALQGFDLGENGLAYLSSYYEELSGAREIAMYANLNITDGYGIKFDNEYILYVRKGGDNIVSLSAPGKVLNLGDKGGIESNPLLTQYITLQADLKNDKGTYVMISSNGDGNFPNSFQAGCANSGPIVIRTYYHDTSDCGIVIPQLLSFGNEYGPKMSTDILNRKLVISLPNTYNIDEESITAQFPVELYFESCGYPWRNLSLPMDSSLFLYTKGEFFVFQKPILSKSFAIFSDKYQTRLDENVLFFNTGTFIEGVADGMAFSGNAYFNNNIGSTRFSSGFAGYGWGIIKDATNGCIAATFDELTIRKRMRIYELEVQKHNVTNGSLWVTDSCSGDLVEEL